jgi:hypothetical protein
MQIRELFDSQRDIERPIEKVISYGAAQEERLKAEISEYVVTEKIEQQLEKLLIDMQAAMDSGGQNEVGVWVSGFYGSGKSSFTKYLALALDDRVTIDGKPFIKHFQDRLQNPKTKALLSTVAQRFPAAVVMLDLATESIAGASLAEVTTVLYYKALQWAGFSKIPKVAALERKFKSDGRYEEFEKAFEDKTGVTWLDHQDDPLVTDAVLPSLAHELDPSFFPTAESFRSSGDEAVPLLKDRIEDIINLVRAHSGKDYIVFVIDEVGQYVGGNELKILDLQGMAENLKNIGEGKVWVIGTAQQTLTEDDPRAALNSPELFKVKDRFPISVALESSDIKEICYRRLLAKSSSGRDELSRLFDENGQALRHNTKLEDARFYDHEFGKEEFSNLYPFLPAHFDILLHLLGALAKSTGGVGLRSAIKVIQDVLIEAADAAGPIADRPVGWLATTVTLYDALEKDIRRAFPAIHQAIDKSFIRFSESSLHKDVAKTVGVLQILNNLPVTIANVAALMHGYVSPGSQADAVAAAVDDLLADSIVPLGVNSGVLSFFSEKLNDIEQERANIPPRTQEHRRIRSRAMRELFDPLPKVSLFGNLAVTSGIKLQDGGGSPTSIDGERNPVQIIVEFVGSADYDAKRNEQVEESRQNSAKATVFLLGRRVAEADEKIAEIYRCERIVELHRTDPDQEIREYCNSQTERAAGLLQELRQQFRRSLSQGSFVFSGAVSAVDSLDSELLAAAKKQIQVTAEQLYEKYDRAPHRADTKLAENFLRKATNLAAIDGQTDPLSLVQLSGGTPSINIGHTAMVDVRDHIDRRGNVDGKRLSDDFSAPPFGWSADTLRYIVAALLVAGEIKLKVSGRDVTAIGQQAIDALKTNNTFKNVGVALRDDRPSMEVLARAATRLTELSGDDVIPLEPDISKAAAKFLPRVQQRMAPFAERLKQLGLPGVSAIESLNQTIASLLETDASNAPVEFGAEESDLFNSLQWTIGAERAMSQGLEGTIRSLRQNMAEIRALPSRGATEEIQRESLDALSDLDERLLRQDFWQLAADFNTGLTALEGTVSKAVAALRSSQQQQLRQAEEDFARLPEWVELNEGEKQAALEQLSGYSTDAADDLAGLKLLRNQEGTLGALIAEVRSNIVSTGQERQRSRAEAQQQKAKQKGEDKVQTRSASIPSSVNSIESLDAFIRELQILRGELQFVEEFELTFTAGAAPKDETDG